MEAFGTQVRLKMDPVAGLGRGFCFVVYTNWEVARTCVKALKNYQIAPNHKLKSTSSCRTVNIPKRMNKDQLIQEFSKFVPGVPGFTKVNTGRI